MGTADPSNNASATPELVPGPVPNPLPNPSAGTPDAPSVWPPEPVAEPARCDVCEELIPEGAEDDETSLALPGRGLYVWTRGDEVRYEEAPLCASCALAIGASALARWEIEEEEG